MPSCETFIFVVILMLAVLGWGVKRRVKQLSESDWAKKMAKNAATGLLEAFKSRR